MAVVNATFAGAAFGNSDALGRRITMKDPDPRTVEIVGIVQDEISQPARGRPADAVHAPRAEHEAAALDDGDAAFARFRRRPAAGRPGGAAASGAAGCIFALWGAKFTGTVLYGVTPAQPEAHQGRLRSHYLAGPASSTIEVWPVSL